MSLKPTAILSIDLEDYRRQELRDHGYPGEPPHPREVLSQLEETLDSLAENRLRGTFFSVGRLTRELPSWVWSALSERHELGCHGYEHLRTSRIGPARFEQDLLAAKKSLEDSSGAPITAFRSPYFSADGCAPWFGSILAKTGFTLDSSLRLRSMPLGHQHTYPLEGSGNQVLEVPVACVGFGSKRLAVIGGTYFRLLPVPAIARLMRRAAGMGFLPHIYLHPYDFDASAPPLSYHGSAWQPRLGDWIRRQGRASTSQKLRALATSFSIHSFDTFLASTQKATPQKQFETGSSIPVSSELPSFSVATSAHANHDTHVL